MDFTIKRDVFLEGLQKTLSITEKKTTLPILNNILIKTESDGIKIVAMDRELTLSARYEALILQEGAVTVLGRKIHDLVRECQGEEVHFQSSDSHLITVSCQRAIFKIFGISAEEYPVIIDEYGELFKIDSDILKNMIAKSIFAVSSDEKRKNLTGVFFKTEKDEGVNNVVMVATDGNRLAYTSANLPVEGFLDVDKGIIIPKRSLSEIRKLIESGPEVYIGLDRGVLVVKRDQVVLRVNLINEQYPNYSRVIPSEFDHSVIFNKDIVLHALRRMSVVATDTYNAVKIKLSHNSMALNSVNEYVGEANDIIDVRYEGEDVEIGFNVMFLLDAIEAIDEEEVIFNIGGARGKSLIKPMINDKYKYVVMPLKLD